VGGSKHDELTTVRAQRSQGTFDASIIKDACLNVHSGTLNVNEFKYRERIGENPVRFNSLPCIHGLEMHDSARLGRSDRPLGFRSQ